VTQEQQDEKKKKVQQIEHTQKSVRIPNDRPEKGKGWEKKNRRARKRGVTAAGFVREGNGQGRGGEKSKERSKGKKPLSKTK